MTENAVLKSEIRTEWIEILKNLPESISVIVVTSGIRSVWKSLVKQVGLDIPVFAANKSSHGFAVDGAAKKDLVTRIRNRSPNSTIFAFGDSAVDIPMMIESDYGIIVSSLRNSGQEETDLRMVGQNFSQILLPADSTPRNNVAVTTLDAILKYSTSDSQCFTHFTKETSSKILSTRLRNSCNNGPTLRSLHNIVGQHLALKLADRLKTEEICFNHVQGTVSSGFRMNDEKQTLIVPLMRGGEPMAFGVSEIFQEASFIHAKIPTDIQDKDLIYCKRVVLVDSVINNGKSIREFIHDFIDRNLGSFEVWILVAVTQKHASRSLAREFGFYSGNCVKKVSFFSLRISENKYTGVGGTDTGHRLFNTIHRD